MVNRDRQHVDTPCYAIGQKQKGDNMVRILVMYPNNGEDFNLDYYLNQHIPLCHKLLDDYGLLRTEVDKGSGAGAPGVPAPYHVVAHLVFRSEEEMQKGLQAAGAELDSDLANFTTIKPQFQISEIIK